MLARVVSKVSATFLHSKCGRRVGRMSIMGAALMLSCTSQTHGMAAPKLLNGDTSALARQARAAGVYGTVVAECTLTSSGRLTKCRVVKSLPNLDGAVLDALYSRRYTPA